MSTTDQAISAPPEIGETYYSLSAVGRISPRADIALLTGGGDRPYVFGLRNALLEQGLTVDVVGADVLFAPELVSTPGLRFLNFQESWPPEGPLLHRLLRVLYFYAKLLWYVAATAPPVLHILWNHHQKLEHFDRTALMLIYKLFGKRLVMTAHNVNTAKRDGYDSWLNRFTLGIQYRLCDHVFVHTEAMLRELTTDFNFPPSRASVIPFGINNSIPTTDLSHEGARRCLGLDPADRIVLFFGRIQPYKGLQHLVEAMIQLMGNSPEASRYRLIIAGQPMKEYENYWREIEDRIDQSGIRSRVLLAIEHIPESEVERYYKAADIAVLPYVGIYQSGVLFLSYSFGVPVLATEVEAFASEIVVGETGFLARPGDPAHLAAQLQRYFESPLFEQLEMNRSKIFEYVNHHHSWSLVGRLTRNVYDRLQNVSPQ